jgi:hypothetical protein
MLTGDKLLKVYNNKHSSMCTTQRGAEYFEIYVHNFCYSILKKLQNYTGVYCST